MYSSNVTYSGHAQVCKIACKIQIFESAVFAKMPKAYAEDLRWRAVWLHLVRGLSYADVAQTLFMCEKSVQRYLALFHATGGVDP